MTEIFRVALEVPEADLLSAIWYSDGSGAHGLGGVAIDLPSSEFEIRTLEMFKRRGVRMVRIELNAIPPESDPEPTAGVVTIRIVPVTGPEVDWLPERDGPFSVSEGERLLVARDGVPWCRMRARFVVTLRTVGIGDDGKVYALDEMGLHVASKFGVVYSSDTP